MHASRHLRASRILLSSALFAWIPIPAPAHAAEAFVLWPDGAPRAVGAEPADIPTLAPFLPPEASATGAAVVVCPGGGYGGLAAHEGAPVAEWLNSLGVAGFVLRYRHAPRYRHPAPLEDAARAIRTVRARAEEWKLRPDRIGILGFSAGGHLASTAATHFDAGKPDAADPIERVSSRPDAAILIYPVITMRRATHGGSRRNLLGEDPPEELVALLSNDQRVTSETPPSFLVHTADDAVVPCENSLLYAAGCRKAGVPHELHLFERGPHGFGLGRGDPALSTWPELCRRWLAARGFVGPGAAPPKPLPPVPTSEQAAWQESELLMFLHFGVNTFTGREWGDGKEDPAIFDPAELDARQWARVAKETGFRCLILTAKHHDGFCLWPSAHTEHSVKRSPWRGGKGDVVADLAVACREAGLRLGIYLSPWDRHEPKYADSKAYDAHFRAQLEELLAGYGDVHEVWFDGAGSEGHVYDWAGYYALVRRLQPGALIAISGPDIRWVGNESGVARETEWSVQPASPSLHPGVQGSVWYPAECDVSIRPGWFWRESEDSQVKTLEHLVDIYFRSVGRNAALLLNVPPDKRGLLPEPDVRRLREFRAALDAIFSLDFARGKPASASNHRGKDPAFAPGRAVDGDETTYWAADDGVLEAWLEVDLGAEVAFNVSRIEEAFTLGQRIEAYRVEAFLGGGWKAIAKGTTVGRKKLDRFPLVEARRVRLVVEKARACPAIRSFGLHRDPRGQG
ncbi:MAG: alpha-L-fucosidase [Planctomycetota bacterium]